MLNEIISWSTLIANIFTIAASGLAIYVYFSKKEQITSLFDLLVNFSHQISLSEVKEKIERLNEYNAKEPEECEKIVNIFNEIIGQIKGNEKLSVHFSDLLLKMQQLADDKRKLTEPRKRAVVSELREKIRHLNVKNIDRLIGDKK